MAMGSQTYGVQVGNETYSVVATEEDWEKRRIERERQKRLSQETNRRRRALEERKKLAEEREARKRILQLSKRRQRQTEATEKYQRSHISTKNENKIKGNKRSPALDNVLQQLRSGNTEITYPHGGEGARNASTQLMNHSRFQFESKLQEEHKRLLELHRANMTKEIDEEIFNDLYHNDVDSSLRDQQGNPPQTFYPAQPLHDFSTIDLMSGQMHAPFSYSPPVQVHGRSNDDAPDAPHNRDYVQLADSLSRLFMQKEPNKRHADVDAPRDDDFQHELSISDDVTQSRAQQQRASGLRHDVTHSNIPDNPKYFQVRPSSGKKHATFPQQHVTIHEAWRAPSDGGNDQSSDSEQGNQESLHGSTATSPVVNTMTSFQKKYAEATNRDERHQLGSVRDEGVKVQPTTEALTRQQADGSGGYYVKAYRPWSAVETIATKNNENEETRRRPMSAVATQSHSKPPQHPPAPEPPSRLNGEPTNQTFQYKSDVGRDSIARWGASAVKTKATPISDMYNEAWMKPVESPQKSDPLLPHRDAVASSSPSPAVPAKPSPKEEVATVTEVAPLSRISAQARRESVKTKSELLSDTKPEERNTSSPKSILRGASKYASKPSYQTEAAAARRQWVDHMTGSSQKLTSTGKLNGADVRDSLDMKSKSVRWHEIRYDDGTLATFTDSGAVLHKPSTAHPAIAASSKRSPRAGNKSPKNKPQSKPKGKPSPEKSGKKAPAKGGKGRKLKPAKESEIAIEPHPPPTSKKQLSIANNLNYSIASEPEQSSRPRGNEPRQASRTAWAPHESENVTLNTLKSSGSQDIITGMSQSGRSRNQVTINMESREVEEPPSPEQTINLAKTPTDQEINWLWDKVRKCISQRSGGRNNPLCKSSSDTSRFSGSSPYSRQQVYGAPPTCQQRPSIVSIDGAMFSSNNTPAHGQPQPRSRRHNRPHSAINVPTRQTNRLNEYGTSLRRQALLQQRRNKLLNMQRTGQVNSPPRYSPHYLPPQQIPPTPSYFEPFPSARGPVTKVDDSTTTFLLAETLAEQNLTEDQITKAMESLERRTREAQARGRQVLPSALSTEEQHLLKSLERLNARLCEVEMAMSSNPNVDFFHSSGASKPRQGRAHSADARQTARYGQYGHRHNY